MSDWQPIETAKRGPAIVWSKSKGLIKDAMLYGNDGRASYGNHDVQTYDVTHWMPDPAPPEETEMTARPIPFSAEMVRAILEGQKTQTRRKMKVQPPTDAVVTVEFYFPIVSNRRGEDWYGAEIFGARWDGDEKGLRCPHGAPGDLLWVREAWRAPPQYDDRPPSRIPPGAEVQYIADALAPWISRYRSPRFMQRPASRITLRITDVRVERLQAISEADARAEGVEPCTSTGWAGQKFEAMTAREVFADRWNHINGPGAWEANPWVWVLSFERVKP